MGKILKGVGGVLFGHPEKSTTKNVNNGLLTDNMGGATAATGQATGLMGTMLNGGPGGYANSGGFNFLLNQGTDAVNSNMASRGLLNSGADMKGLETMRSGLASTYLDQYMNHVNQMGQLGIGAGNVLADSGDQRKDVGKKKGIAGDIIKMAAAASDRRLKKDVEKIGEYADGLGKYRWTYVDGFGLPQGRHEGVMADEVLELRPWAYVPNFIGEYAGVNYGAL